MSIELIFDRERETKNTVRFQERETDDAPAIGTLYVQKHVLKRLGEPEQLRVTLDGASSAGDR